MRPNSPTLYPQNISPVSARFAISSSVGAVPSTSATRVSPLKHLAYVDFPRQMVNTLRGIRKYSSERASANELGGMTQTSPLKSTNDSGEKFLGSTIAE